MAQHFDLEEQEQLDQLKHFWNTWGNLISGIVIVVFGSFAVWNGYQFWQKRQGLQASALFDVVEASILANDKARMEQAFTDLRSGYAGTAQAGLAGLQLAKVQVAAGNFEGAKATLTWVAEGAADQGHQALARLRLASVLEQQQAYDDALKQLSASVPSEFEATVADRKGDILAVQGKKTEAVEQYQKAYKGLQEGVEYRSLVEAKLNALGAQPQLVAQASAAGVQK